jgi:hypothetical protein
MKNVYYLSDWKLDKSVSNAERHVDVSIGLKYPEPKQFIEFKPKERIKKIDQAYKTNLNKLIALNLFETYEITGTKKRPNGVRAKIKYNKLSLLNRLDFISVVSIMAVDKAIHIKKEKVAVDKYFCVKMTVVIEFEGISSKKQKIEKRFVIIKAKSSEDAYKKLEDQKNDYATPYLNSDGRFVRWRIDSFDDCFETDINNPKDLDNPQGVEVYSKLKSRKIDKPIVWDERF